MNTCGVVRVEGVDDSGASVAPGVGRVSVERLNFIMTPRIPNEIGDMASRGRKRRRKRRGNRRRSEETHFS